MLAIALRLGRGAFAVLIVVGTVACEIPNFQGPQVQDVPPGFTLNPETFLEQRMMPEREVIHYDAWVDASWGDFSGIYVTGHPGALSRNDAEQARSDLMVRNVGSLIEFGETEELVIDGRTSWGWTEWWRLENGGLEYAMYRALIPYDTISYTVEFLSGKHTMKTRPDSLRTIVASFAIGETTWNLPLIAVMAGVLLLVLNTIRSRMAAKAARARGITLVQIPKKDDEKKAGGGGAGGSAASPGSTASPGSAGTRGSGGSPGSPGAPGATDSIAASIAKSLEAKKPPPSSG